ncbi:MAG: zinc-ribbon domain-containing protein [Candidatus Lokiarchaeota archaeon]|nr:zinc-ribbon domain-containing protein [Candidatus Lokiarchaeota archaeon]
MSLKIKECKVKILKRMLALEEKYNEKGYISPFSYHETKLTASNIAFWKMAERGVILPEEVRTAIYQLEKAGLLEIVDRTNVKFTERGREVAKKIRSMTTESVPNYLLEDEVKKEKEPEKKESNEKKCSNCGKMVKPSAKFCPFCGNKMKKKEMNCPYCGEKISSRVKFCPNCGASID